MDCKLLYWKAVVNPGQTLVMFNDIEAKFFEHAPNDGISVNWELKIDFIKRNTVMITYGDSIVVGSLTACVSKPSEERPFEGNISFFVSSLLPKEFFNDSQVPIARISSFLEKSFKSSKSLDLESLLISPAASCWALRLDANFIQDGGNLLATSSIAALVLLLTSKIPQTTFEDSGSTIIHPFSMKNPQSLNMFFKPLAMEVPIKGSTGFNNLYVAFSSTNEIIGVSQESILKCLQSEELSSYLSHCQKRIASLNELISRNLKT